MNSVELFAGAGGLAMGISKAGFRHSHVIERNKYACDTIRENQRLGLDPIRDWPLTESDVREIDFKGLKENVDLVSGGPPCQPFSLGGKHRGPRDDRDMFPVSIQAVRALRPRAFIFENVKGLLRRSFSKYFEYTLLRLTYPEIVQKDNEDWSAHLSRLERHHTRGRINGLHYRVAFQLLNAADYGVPQRRERVFLVGFRSDVKKEWSFPRATQSRHELLRDQWVTGSYWERHRISKAKKPAPNKRDQGLIDKVRNENSFPGEQPWQTVRDAIGDLPKPFLEERESGPLNHILNPGARPYPGHTGSPLDSPAKTLKAGDHGVPGGENMLVDPTGKVRYFTVRESARLQTFPDRFRFHGSWSESMRQLGNAVPVQLAHAVADSVHSCLES